MTLNNSFITIKFEIKSLLTQTVKCNSNSSAIYSGLPLNLQNSENGVKSMNNGHYSETDAPRMTVITGH